MSSTVAINQLLGPTPRAPLNTPSFTPWVFCLTVVDISGDKPTGGIFHDTILLFLFFSIPALYYNSLLNWRTTFFHPRHRYTLSRRTRAGLIF